MMTKGKSPVFPSLRAFKAQICINTILKRQGFSVGFLKTPKLQAVVLPSSLYLVRGFYSDIICKRKRKKQIFLGCVSHVGSHLPLVFLYLPVNKRFLQSLQEWVLSFPWMPEYCC